MAAAQSPRASAAASPPPQGVVPHNAYASVTFPSEPLSVQIIPLRRPEGFAYPHDPLLQCTEPGDLLHEAVAGGGHRAGGGDASEVLDPSQCVVMPAVTYPPRDGGAQGARYLRGEMYRGTLVIHNTTGVEIPQVTARIEVVDPRNTRRAVGDLTAHTLMPFATLERRLDNHEWMSAGRHSVKALVHYADPSRAGELRTVDVSVPLTVGEGPNVLAMDVVSIPAYRDPLPAGPRTPDGTIAEVPPFERILEERYRCIATVSNPTHGPLHLTEVVFRKTPTTHEHLHVHDTANVKAAVQSDGLFLPGEVRRYGFEVTAAPTSSAPLAVAGATGSDAKAQTRPLELGVMRWGWRRPNGDGGHGATPRGFEREASVPLVSSLPPAKPQSGTRAAPPAAAQQAPYLIVRAFSPPHTPLPVGELVALHFAVANATSRAVDLVAVIAPDRLLPNFLFSGATAIPLGMIEPRGVVVMTLTVMPLLDGRLVIDGAGFELRDRLRPDASAPALWPNPACDLRGGGDARDLAVGEFLAMRVEAQGEDSGDL